jgi:hypothetical protein
MGDISEPPSPESRALRRGDLLVPAIKSGDGAAIQQQSMPENLSHVDIMLHDCEVATTPRRSQKNSLLDRMAFGCVYLVDMPFTNSRQATFRQYQVRVWDREQGALVGAASLRFDQVEASGDASP